MKYKTIPFEFTWCDYLTPCPYQKNVMIGEYDCYECEYHMGIKQKNIECDSSIDYSRYAKVSTGVVFCGHD